MRPYKLYEVSAREGWQGLAQRPIPVVAAVIKLLYAAGLRQIEVGSLVHPKVIPALANTEDLIKQLRVDPALAELAMSVLVPTPQAFLKAADLGVAQVALAISREEQFQKKNFHQTLAQAQEILRTVYNLREQKYPGLKIKVYVMLAWLKERSLAEDQALLAELALLADEVCLADTAALATPENFLANLKVAQALVPPARLGLHLHGRPEEVLTLARQAVAAGVLHFDSALGGCGGCPFLDHPTANADTLALAKMLREHFGLSPAVLDEDLLAQAAATMAQI